jgi:hypothetical protein
MLLRRRVVGPRGVWPDGPPPAAAVDSLAGVSLWDGCASGLIPLSRWDLRLVEAPAAGDGSGLSSRSWVWPAALTAPAGPR